MRAAALVLLLAFTATAEPRSVLVRESLTGTHYRLLAPDDRYIRRIFYESELKPWAFDYDRTTGVLVRKIPLWYNSEQPARVFDPNPVVATNDPSLRDQNDAATAVPEHAYEQVTLDLAGPHARVVDRQSPHTPLPNADAPLLFDREDDRFEPVNAVFHIDRTQRHLQSLGYSGRRQLVPYAIEVDANAVNGGDASFFLPSLTDIGRGTLFYGTGGTDDAEDGDIVVHEYAHAIIEWIAPGTFAGTFGSEARALVEGIPDYLAFSAHYEQRVAAGRDPFCFADWDARCWTDAPSEGCAYPPNSDCLRRLDSPRTMADYQRSDSPGVEHRNGQIWSSALREIFLKLGRETTDVLVIESIFGAPPNPTFAVMARRMVEVDRLLFHAENAATICAAMTARGIACDGTPRGELTHVQSAERNIAIPDFNPFGVSSSITVTDPRTIEKLAVRVDIDHATRGDLILELHAPDGTKVILKNVSGDVTPGIHATYGIDAASAESLERFRGMSAAGTWTLFIADVRARDAGVLRSWALVIQFTGDEPQTARPRAGNKQMIPVVAHLFGAARTLYASDVRIANVNDRAATATLIFTRSGADGTRDFSAVNVQLAPHQTVSFDDVVASAFFTTGSGSLEILGDVLVTSRLYTRAPDGGTLGQEVPANLAGAARLFVAPPLDPQRRYNLGITETAGVRTTVRFATGEVHVLEPFSHIQIANIGSAELATDGGSILAYVSEVDPATGDLTFFPAQAVPLPTARPIFPAIGSSGADGTRWSTDVWAITDAPWFLTYRAATYTFSPGVYRDVVVGIGAMFLQYTGAYAGVRIGNGRTSQFIPPREPDTRPIHHLIGIDNNDTHRTNIGIVTGGGALAEVVVLDAEGRQVQSDILVVVDGVAQLPVRANVTGGRAIVRNAAGTPIRAYASVIDRRSGDPAFIDGQ